MNIIIPILSLESNKALRSSLPEFLQGMNEPCVIHPFRVICTFFFNGKKKRKSINVCKIEMDKTQMNQKQVSQECLATGCPFLYH